MVGGHGCSGRQQACQLAAATLPLALSARHHLLLRPPPDASAPETAAREDRCRSRRRLSGAQKSDDLIYPWTGQPLKSAKAITGSPARPKRGQSAASAGKEPGG